MHLADVCPLSCAEPDSGVNLSCPSAWALTAQNIGAVCGADAGPTGPTPSKGCGCSLPSSSAGGAAALSVTALAAVWARRRRRRTEKEVLP
jgi:MYXO-CTERM domain-containing protein